MLYGNFREHTTAVMLLAIDRATLFASAGDEEP